MLEDFRLKVFVAVAREKSFTKAAAQLSITQPAVSQHISELEKHLGVKLFERLRGETLLTEAGQYFIEYALRVISTYDEIDQVFKRFPNKVVKVSASDEVYNHLVTNLLGRFLLIHPEIVFQNSFMQDVDLEVKLIPSGNKKRMMELSYHPSSSFAATRLWSVLSEILQPALQ